MPVLDHVSLGVPDLDRARRFYDVALAPLGYRCMAAREQEVAFGLDEAWAFWLHPATPDEPLHGSRGHVAFSAPSPESVRDFHRAVSELGGATVRPPGERPDISPRYYGAVMRDLDGHLIEVVYWSAS